MLNNINILITGGSGYVGSLLCHHFLKSDRVDKVIAISRSNLGEDFLNKLSDKEKDRLIFIKSDTSKEGWQIEAIKYKPRAVVHAAWQIVENYKNISEELNRKYANILGSEKVFDFAFNNQCVNKLIYLSSSAVYGNSKNDPNKLYGVEDALNIKDLGKINHVYTKEKVEVENFLKEKYNMSNKKLDIYVLRSVELMDTNKKVNSSGLRSSLLSQIKFLPVGKYFYRQYIGEQDFLKNISEYIFNNSDQSYKVINLYSKDLSFDIKSFGDFTGKKLVVVPDFIIRILFFLAWHISTGKISTPPGSANRYLYPVKIKLDF